MPNVIDLSQTPAPDVVEPLDYEQIRSEMIADLQARDPNYTAILESDPAVKVLEVAAYRELLLRQRINEAAKAVMLPYAEDKDLDNLGVLFGVKRLVTQAADLEANPPIFEEKEKDPEYRRRIQLSLEGLSVAGPEGAYIFHALSADGRVLDASAHSPSAGEVVVTVLSRDNNGAASADLLATVEAAVSAEEVRPLTDHVTVQAAELVEYAIRATIYVYEGPDSSVVLETAQSAIEQYTLQQHRLGLDVVRSGIYAALHQAGVQGVDLETPGQTYTISRQQAPRCTGIHIEYGGVRE